MIALVGYRMACLLHSQRYVPPMLVFLAVLTIGSVNNSGPVAPVYAVSSGALFGCAVWLTVALVNIEGPEHRAITVLSAGSSVRVVAATTIAALGGCVLLTGIGVVFPLVVGSPQWSAQSMLLGVVAHLVCACAGAALGLLCSRLVLPRPGYALVVAVAGGMLLLLAPGVPPVHPVLLLLASGQPEAQLWSPIALQAAVAACLLVVAAAAAEQLARRRE